MLMIAAMFKNQKMRNWLLNISSLLKNRKIKTGFSAVST